MKRIHDATLGSQEQAVSSPPMLSGLPYTQALHLVTLHELEDLREALRQGRVPFDLQAKLALLAGTDLVRHFIEHNSRLFLALLQAAAEGAFHCGSAAERERLLQVLAYVRKNDDAIPDHRTDGYVDDYREVRAAVLDLAPLLREFKRWRLRHEVPRLWLNPAAQR